MGRGTARRSAGSRPAGGRLHIGHDGPLRAGPLSRTDGQAVAVAGRVLTFWLLGKLFVRVSPDFRFLLDCAPHFRLFSTPFSSFCSFSSCLFFSYFLLFLFLFFFSFIFFFFPFFFYFFFFFFF